MFAKLKKKIAEEEGVDEGELKVSPGGAQRRNSRDTPRRPSDLAKNNLSPLGTASPVSKQDSAYVGLNHVNGDDQIRRLEEKLDEYSHLLKEAVRAKEKAENTVITHEEATNQKIQGINEQYQLRRAKMTEKLASAVKKKEDEMSERLEEVEKENSSLQERLQRLELTRFKKEEEQEDFQGFQVQELAKVKHMLLNNQESLQKCKTDLQQTREKLSEKTQLCDQHSLTIQTLKQEKESITVDRDQLQKAKDEMEETLSRLEKGTALLKERCCNLTKDKQERESHIAGLEMSLAKCQEDLDAAQYNERASKSQAKKDVEEKDRSIFLLQDKLSVLEQRLQDNSLSEDDQVTAIKTERDLLEKKLEEARNQLSNLKISSSEQISGLEKQISHLNAKITEDQVDQADCQRDLDSSTQRYQAEMCKMEKRIKELEEERELNLQKLKKQAADLVLQKSASETGVMNIQRNHEQSKKVISDQKQVLQEKVAGLEAKIIQLETARDFDKSASEHKIGRLQSSNEEYLEKEIEHEKQVTQLEEEKEKLQALCQSLNSGEYLEHEKAISKELADLYKERELTERQQLGEAQARTLLEEGLNKTKAELTLLQDKLSNAKEVCERLEGEKKRLEEKLREQEERHKNQSQEYTSMVSKLTDKQIEIDDSQKEHALELAETQKSMSEKDGALSVLRETITQKESCCKEYEDKIKHLEERLNVKHSELENHQQGSQEIGQRNEALTDTLRDLEDQLLEKNKTIKMQQQRLTDLKKTLSRELKNEALTDTVRDLEVQLIEKNKTIRMQQQRLIDFKKTLSRELKVQAASSGPSRGSSLEDIPRVTEVQERRAPSPVRETASQPAAITANSLNHGYSNNSHMDYREINFRYLRHVVFKFMSGTDLECIQLLKAVSVVLEFTQQEQKIIRETLEWKNSWFGERPRRKNWDVKLPSVSPHIR